MGLFTKNMSKKLQLMKIMKAVLSKILTNINLKNMPKKIYLSLRSSRQKNFFFCIYLQYATFSMGITCLARINSLGLLVALMTEHWQELDPSERFLMAALKYFGLLFSTTSLLSQFMG